MKTFTAPRHSDVVAQLSRFQIYLSMIDSRNLYGRVRIAAHDGEIRVSLFNPVLAPDNQLFGGNPPASAAFDYRIEGLKQRMHENFRHLKHGVFGALDRLQDRLEGRHTYDPVHNRMIPPFEFISRINNGQTHDHAA